MQDLDKVINFTVPNLFYEIILKNGSLKEISQNGRRDIPVGG